MVELVQQHPSGGYILDELHVGMAAEKIVVATEDRIRLFAEASDDFNPVHLDEAFASKTAYRGRIAHGLLSASFGSAVVGTILPGAGSIYISQALAPLGVDILYLLPFDGEMAGMSDADFAEKVLARGLGVRHAAVGFDFTFGKGRSGSPEALKTYCERLGFTVSVAERLDDADGLKLSSSAVREALKAGDMDRAAAILGRPFALQGEVIHGDKRGRTIGVPAANIALGDYMRPAYGVYATRSRLADGRVVNGVASLGVRPMYALETPLLEVWLFDFDGDLYGQVIETELVAWLRGEESFDGLR